MVHIFPVIQTGRMMMVSDVLVMRALWFRDKVLSPTLDVLPRLCKSH